MEKSVLTLDEILDHYFYKEWVQEELRAMGETTSGDKSELVERFLNSKKIRRRSVDEIAIDLISSLRVTELRQIAKDLGVKHQGKHTQVLKRILASVTFEPFVRSTKRHCVVCLNETPHELHFGADWQANYFECEICGKVSSVRPIENGKQGDHAAPPTIIDARCIGPIEVPETKVAGVSEQSVTDFGPAMEMVTTLSEGHEEKTHEDQSIPVSVGDRSEPDSISQQALAWAIALGGVTVFLAVFIPVGLVYGWIAGLVYGVVSTILAGVILIPTRRYWVRRLLRLVR